MMPFLFLPLILLLTFAEASAAPVVDPEACSASYVEWVDEAAQAAQGHFPEARVQDFLYVGCKPLADFDKEYVYKFWMREGDRFFGAYVALRVDPAEETAKGATVEGTESSIPSYEKWRDSAVRIAKSAYPDMNVVDMRPCRCEASADGTGSQRFRVWLQGRGASKLLDVVITYRIRTETVISTDVEVIRTW